ncbi:Crp/Fnr family transcriptional regulator [Streptomyces sp. NBC_01356]|uniref:Crp/Fnr family transcriptional regulator n=1 Tax=Streptomyces sp. NBC_01356 TaxID=2903836 RepID=UPI002E319640|nr:Crp/Fnr family transcriptional regulator [Streptomyces sp. NBC_01356]
MDSKDASRAETGRRPDEEWDWPSSSLLGGLGQAERDRLLTLGARMRYPAERVLIREGDETDFVLILLDGLVKVTGRADDGRDALLAVRVGGDVVGELAAVDGQPRSATVTACGPVLARSVTRVDFLACTRREPRIAHALHQTVVAKLRAATTHRVTFTGCDAATRVARVLHHLAMTYGDPVGAGAEIRWPITQPELATLAGASEPSVQKALRGLKKAGVVTPGYRSIRVDDLDRLSEIAYPER